MRRIPRPLLFGTVILLGCFHEARAQAEAAAETLVSTPVQLTSTTLGPFTLEANRLMQVPAGIFRTSFPEPVWLLSYRTEIVDADGQVLDKDLHCHTMFKTVYSDEWKAKDGKPFKGLFSDGNSNALSVPEGFGIFYDAGETLELIPMFNNRNATPLRAGMRFTVEYVPVKDLAEPLRPLYSMVESIINPHLYMVKPGVDVREREFKFPFDGRIHMMGIHIHPYGRSMELVNETRGETVWKAFAELNEAGTVETMPVYRNPCGYRVTSGETYRMRATYENTTSTPQDAMAGFVILFNTDDGKMPRPTEATPAAEEDPTHQHCMP